MWIGLLVGIGPLFQSVACQMKSNVCGELCVYLRVCTLAYLQVYLWLKT